MLPPTICLIGQGVKRVLLGKDAYVYDAQSFLLSSVELPVVAEILEASREKPYLGLTLELDLKEISQLMEDTDLPSPPSRQGECRAMAVSKMSSALVSDQGPRLRQIVSAGNHSHQIARAIDWLKDNFKKPLQVKELAAYAWMSDSSFHQHFRSLTAMTPIQYQKKLRLNEARRLMLAENLDAANAAFQVGYESPSQFSREYNRLFGAPPLRDIKSLRQISTG